MSAPSRPRWPATCTAWAKGEHHWQISANGTTFCACGTIQPKASQGQSRPRWDLRIDRASIGAHDDLAIAKTIAQYASADGWTTVYVVDQEKQLIAAAFRLGKDAGIPDGGVAFEALRDWMTP